MITVLDASVMIAALDNKDHHHQRVKAFLQATSSQLRVHPLTLAEALVQPVRFGHGELILATLTQSGIIPVAGDTVTPLVLATTRQTSGLKLPDAIVLATAQILGASLATVDAKLASAAAAVGITLALDSHPAI
jgi:predicted nucleic acid-binding protein